MLRKTVVVTTRARSFTSASSSSVVPTPSHRALVLSLYRSLLHSARFTDDPHDADSEIKRAFRAVAIDNGQMKQRVRVATDKLAFIHAMLPGRLWKTARERTRERLRRPLLRRLTADEDDEDDDTMANSVDTGGVETFRYDQFGEPILPDTPPPLALGGRISNSAGLTDDQYKKHYSLMERFHFGGPRWKGGGAK